MSKKIISTEKSPAAIGPYSQAVAANGFLFVSGQIPIDPAVGILVENDIKSQTKQVLKNVKNILEAAGTSMENVVKTTVFLQNMGDFSDMNDVYAEFFSEPFPARAAVQVAKLPKDALVEIEVVALL